MRLQPTRYLLDLDLEIAPIKESATLGYSWEPSVLTAGAGELPSSTVVTAPAVVPAPQQVGFGPSAAYTIHVEIRAGPKLRFDSWSSCPEAERSADHFSITVAPAVVADHTPGAAFSSQLHVTFIAGSTTGQSVLEASHRL